MKAAHPYRELPDYQFWPRAVTWAAPGSMDPVTHPRFTVTHEDRVVTMGSCFAQHLSRHLARSGLTYLVTERGPDDPDEARRRTFGVFSARYGNVYTVAQAIQLFERAYERRPAFETAWKRDAVLVDPYRPQAEPDGFVDEDALEADRAGHLRATRDAFEQATVFVFTLGLTEAWRSRSSGDVFPTAPGVAGGDFDPAEYEFVNYGVDEVRTGLFEFCDLVRSVNPTVRMLLTVSPVPLVATYEDRHVVVSTTYSKSVLRVAAEEATLTRDFVDYFPSYEIITSSASGRSYYAPDLREVDDAGVRHVMRCFTRHYVDGLPWQNTVASGSSATSSTGDVVCDEEAIAAAIERSAPVQSSAPNSDPVEWGPGLAPPMPTPTRAPARRVAPRPGIVHRALRRARRVVRRREG
jgi:hypothetical protein